MSSGQIKKKGRKKKRIAKNKIKKTVRRAIIAASKPAKVIVRPKRRVVRSDRLETRVAVPAAFGSTARVGAPRINGGRVFVVSHTEYLDDVYGLADWDIASAAIQVYDLNPGLSSEFPWLSSIAGNFEQYRWRKLKFHFKSRLPTSQAGTIYMSTQLDVNDPNFSSKQEMYNYVGTTSNECWMSYTHNCLLKRNDYLKKYFIRTGPVDVSAAQDLQMYDQGRFTYVPITAANLYSGDLMVEYEVELYNPRMNPNLLSYIGCSSASFRGNDTAHIGITDRDFLYSSFPNDASHSQIGDAPLVCGNYQNGIGISTLGTPYFAMDSGSYKMCAVATQNTSVDINLVASFVHLNQVSGTTYIGFYRQTMTDNTTFSWDYKQGNRSCFADYYWWTGLVTCSISVTTSISPVTYNIFSAMDLVSVPQSVWNGFNNNTLTMGHPGVKFVGKDPKGKRPMFKLDFSKGPIVIRCGGTWMIHHTKSQMPLDVERLIKEYKDRKKSSPLDLAPALAEQSDSDAEVLQVPEERLPGEPRNLVVERKERKGRREK